MADSDYNYNQIHPYFASLFPCDRPQFFERDLSNRIHDLTYWLSRTPEDRIAGLEYMGQIAYGTDPVNDRMDRVIEVVDLKSK
jgi:hypothetical protein